jgi:hypothetical protein
MQKNVGKVSFTAQKLQFQTILFPYKMSVTEENKFKQIEIPYTLTVLLSIPLNKLPCGEVGVVVLEGEGVGGELA